VKNREINKISIRTIKYGYSININDKSVFAILYGDAGTAIGKDKEKLKEYAKEALKNIGAIIEQEKKKQDSEDLKHSILTIFIALIITIFAFFLMKKIKTIVDNSMEKWITAILKRISSQEFTFKYSRIFTVYLKRTLLVIYYILIFLIIYIDLAVVLAGIPLTSAWANGLLVTFKKILNSFYSGFLKMLPGLIIVIMIMFGTKILVGLANIFFEGIENDHIKFDWIDKDTIVPTKRITAAFLWVIGVALAYPFIPGSGSEAFKGISVLIGVMFSIGSSNIMSQAISGLIIIYTKGIKVGDYVKVKDYEGIILHTGVFTVKIRTTSQEEINIPNSVLLDSITTNYTTLKEEKGVALEIKLGLDYDVPWRQVNAMVLEAIKMTRSLRQDSKPNIFQSDMADYYMEYTVRTWIDRPELRRSIRSELYQNIQDVFNKYDVQIMTPRYLTLFKSKMVVPPDKWYLEPASHNEDDQIEVTGLYDAKNADGTPFLKRLNEKDEPKQEEIKEDKKDDRANKKNSGKSKKS
ncbi:mechanosensitive ion channel, partial [bacterium]|nr:mechanosensitive ion channel [bacterium]